MHARFHIARLFAVALAAVLLGAAGDELAPVRPATDTYFGTAVVDPYRYMETAGEPDYTAWKSKQLAATAAMLVQARKATGFDAGAPPAADTPELRNLTVVRGRLYYLQSTARADRLLERDLHGGAPRTIARSGQFDTRAGHAGLGAFDVSTDAKLVAIHVSIGKNRDSDIHILRVADGKDVEAPLHDTTFDYVGFTPDGARLLYAEVQKSTVNPADPYVAFDYLHRLGTAQARDSVIFGAGVSPRVKVPPHSFAFVDPRDGKHLLAEVRDVAAGASRFYEAPGTTLGKPGIPWRALGSAKDHFTDYAAYGDTIDFATSNAAPNFKVVRASLNGPFAPHDVLPASDTVVVSGTLDGIPKAGIFALNSAADADYVQLLDHGVNRLVRIPYVESPKVVPVKLPLAGSILQVGVDAQAAGAAFELTGWTNPGDVYAFAPARGTALPIGIRTAGADPNRVAEELSATAPDGTEVPVSVVHRPGIALDGSHPLLLRVAGAYGFSFTPDYGEVPEAWLAHGGVFAVAHVRGGGELGEKWHLAGMGPRKSNTWTDLIAAAQRLIAAGYTSPEKLGLYGTRQSYLGGIASSIAIGRAIEERPDLFAAAVIDVPVFDLLRSERTDLGGQSVSEFGSVATRPGFTALLAMSPYEHLKPGVAYPPLLIRSAAHYGLGDDWQAAKMVARLESVEGRSDAAYLDILADSPDDRRTTAQVRDDGYAFLLYEDGVR